MEKVQVIMCLESWNWHYFCWKSVEFVFIDRRMKGQGILEWPLFQGTLPEHAFSFAWTLHFKKLLCHTFELVRNWLISLSNSLYLSFISKWVDGCIGPWLFFFLIARKICIYFSNIRCCCQTSYFENSFWDLYSIAWIL